MAGPSHGNSFSRRRRQNSVDGSVPGASPTRFIRGAHFAGTPNPADLTSFVRREELPHPTKEYDPIHPEYPTLPGYDPPDPWDAISLEHPTPPLRLDWPERPGPRPPSYGRSVAFARMIGPLIQEFRDLRAAGEPIPADLAQLYESLSASQPHVFNSDAIGASPISPTSFDLGPETGAMPLADPVLDALAIQMTGIPVDAMAIDFSQEMPLPETDLAMPGQYACPMEMSLSDMAEAMMPAAEPLSLLEAPMTDFPDPIGDSPAMTLDAIVEQMMPEPAPPPEIPDPFALMQNQFNQQMQMMDPFNMMGPMM